MWKARLRTCFFCNVNFLDIFIGVAIIYGTWAGFRKGLIIELFMFLALFLGLYASIRFSDFFSGLLLEWFDSDSKYLPVISFTILFLLVGAMVYFAGKTIEKIVKVVQLSLVNKFAGALFGGLKFALLVGGLILVVEAYEEKANFIDEETKEESLLYLPLKKATVGMIPALGESTMFLKNALKENKPEENENPLFEEPVDPAVSTD